MARAADGRESGVEAPAVVAVSTEYGQERSESTGNRGVVLREVVNLMEFVWKKPRLRLPGARLVQDSAGPLLALSLKHHPF
jgi:hypothetical protein